MTRTDMFGNILPADGSNPVNPWAPKPKPNAVGGLPGEVMGTTIGPGGSVTNTYENPVYKPRAVGGLPGEVMGTTINPDGSQTNTYENQPYREGALANPDGTLVRGNVYWGGLPIYDGPSQQYLVRYGVKGENSGPIWARMQDVTRNGETGENVLAPNAPTFSYEDINNFDAYYANGSRPIIPKYTLPQSSEGKTGGLGGLGGVPQRGFMPASGVVETDQEFSLGWANALQSNPEWQSTFDQALNQRRENQTAQQQAYNGMVGQGQKNGIMGESYTTPGFGRVDGQAQNPYAVNSGGNNMGWASGFGNEATGVYDPIKQTQKTFWGL